MNMRDVAEIEISKAVNDEGYEVTSVDRTEDTIVVHLAKSAGCQHELTRIDPKVLEDYLNVQYRGLRSAEEEAEFLRQWELAVAERNDEDV